MAGTFYIAAGGTGGHILPGIRIGRELQSTRHFNITYLCGQRPIELEIYRSESIAPVIVQTGARRLPLGPATQMAEMTIDFTSLLYRFLRDRPAGILAMGGAVCFPALAAATVLRIPIFLHESNRIPGRVIRTFHRFARRVFLGLGGLKGENVMVTGTPTKPSVSGDALRDTILCVGGSQGAGALNSCFVSAANASGLAAQGYQFVLLSGHGKSIQNPGCVDVRAYEPNMPELLARTVICVSRSGAGALADFANFRVPSILIPYPHAMDDHQAANARVYQEVNAAVVILEKDLGVTGLKDTLLNLFHNPQQLADMTMNLARFDSSDSATKIVRAIEESLSIRSQRPSRAPSMEVSHEPR